MTWMEVDQSTLARRAPLALSANGEWRVHVDRARVLHRPPLAGSATESACVGLVNFGRKLLVVSATLGEGYESPSTASARAVPRHVRGTRSTPEGRGRGPSGFTEELVVRELATGRGQDGRLLRMYDWR